jgi:hypothetical protein
MVAAVVAGVMAVSNVAEAAWEQYINEEFHFGVDFPAEPNIRMGIHQGAVSGERPATIFEAVSEGVTYRAIVVDISDELVNSGSILEEAIYIWGLDGEIVIDMSARTGPCVLHDARAPLYFRGDHSRRRRFGRPESRPLRADRYLQYRLGLECLAACAAPIVGRRAATKSTKLRRIAQTCENAADAIAALLSIQRL